MSSLRSLSYRMRRIVAAGALLAATVVPAALPGLVSAATLTERSVAMTSASKGATGVSYTVSFKAAQDATGAFIVDFCTDSVVGTACTTPAGLNVTTPTTTGSDTVSAIDANTVKVVLATPVDTDGQVTVTLGGLTNPTNAGSIYARIVSYTDGTSAGSNDSETPGTHLDEGSVALSINDNFSVGGSVLESLVFCASAPYQAANPIGSGCTGTHLTTPNVSLGTNGILSSTLSEGTIYSQISTNAAHGAVVNLKSSTVGCGGLMLEGASGAAACGITPVATTPATIADNAAKFGLKLGGLTATTGTVAASGNYGTSNYFMNYINGDATGVTSTYGDPIYNTDGKPVNNGSVDLTFGANISNVTPAGNYKASLSLIATGTF